MRLLPALVAALMLAAAAWPATGRQHRSNSQRAAFQLEHPCPATGKRRGPCPGHVIDHVQPLCAGGEDAPRNMQWQLREDARVKDRAERRMCRHR